MEGNTEFWTSHVEACRREGSAASVYARRHGLTLASLYYWQRKLKLAASVNDDGGPAGKFVALRVMDVAAGAPTGQCILVLRCAAACAWSWQRCRRRPGCWLSTKPTLEFADAPGLPHRPGVFMPRPGRLSQVDRRPVGARRAGAGPRSVWQRVVRVHQPRPQQDQGAVLAPQRVLPMAQPNVFILHLLQLDARVSVSPQRCFLPPGL